MNIDCIECDYNCGTPHIEFFHYKIEHKDNVIKCACGNESLSDNCVGEMVSKIRGITPKCSNYNSNSNSNSTSNSGSISNSNSTTKSDSRSNSNFTSNSNSSFASSSNFHLISNSCFASNSNFTSNTSPTSDSNLISNSNFTSNSILTSKSISTSNSNHTSNPSFTANSSSIPSSTSSSNPTSRFTNTNIKIDTTNKACNRRGVIKEIICFDKKKAICTKCNATKMKCEYCTSIISFSWLKGHMKNFHEEINLTRGVYSVYELESINKIKPVSQFIKSNAVFEPKIIGTPILLNGKAWLKTHDTNITDGEGWWKTHEPNLIDKPNIIDDEAW